MKKVLALLLALLLVVGTFAACDIIEKETDASKEDQSESDESEAEKESDEKESNTENGGNENEEPEEEPLVESTAGFEFVLNEDGKGYTLVGKGTCTATEIVIDGYNGLPVTSIGDYVFCECSSLTSVTIGNNVTSIGEFAFVNCDSLTSVTIGNGVTSIGKWAFASCFNLASITVEESNAAYKSIDGNLYSKDGKILIQYAIDKDVTSFIVPDNVTSIGAGAFVDCFNLASITIPNSVTSIGSEAFCGCSSLTSITIPNSVTSIGDGAFAFCYSLTSIKYRGTQAQWGNVSKSNAKIPSSCVITYNYTGE